MHLRTVATLAALALASAAVLAAVAGGASATSADASAWPDARRGLLDGEGTFARAPLDLVQGERAPLVLRGVESGATLRLVASGVEHEQQLDVGPRGVAWLVVPRDMPAGDARLVIGDSTLDVRIHEGPRLFSLDATPPAVGTRASLEAAGFDADDPLSVAIVQGPLRWTASWDATGAAATAEAPHVDDAAAVMGLASSPGGVDFLVAAWDGAAVRVWFNGTVDGAPRSLDVAWVPEPRSKAGVWFEPVHAQGIERFQAGSTAFVHGVGFEGDVVIQMVNGSTTLDARDAFFAGWIDVPTDAPAEMRVLILSNGTSGEPMVGEQWVEVDPPTALLEATAPPLQAEVYELPAPHAALVLTLVVGVALSVSRRAPRRGP